jgi:hypothetical protein
MAEKHVKFSDRKSSMEVSTEEKLPSNEDPSEKMCLNLDLKKVDASMRLDRKRNVSNLKIIT